MNEMHVYDEESREEEALCGTETCDIDRIDSAVLHGEPH